MHKLALGMGKTVGELSACMTTDELTNWLAYDRQRPVGFGFLEFDRLIASLTARIASMAGVKRHGGGQFKESDFRMFEPRDTRTPMEFMMGLFGGRVVKKDK